MCSKLPTQIIKILVLLITSQNLLAQSPNLRQITDAEGLPSMTIYDILQDRKGYIWLGTEAGICKYDGYKFQTFEVPTARGKSFTHLVEDLQGRIYFSNFANQLFYIFQEKVYEISLPKAVQKYGLRDYLIDQNGNIWLLSNNMYQYDKQSQQWITYDLSALKLQYKANRITLDSDNQIWLQGYSEQSKQTLYNLEPQSKSIKPILTNLPKSNTFYISNNRLYCLDTRRHYFYTCTEQNNHWKIQKTDLPKLTKVMLNTLSVDKEHNVWIASTEGATYYSSKPQKFQPKLTVLKGKFVSEIMQDFEGNYWFTTIGNGIYVLSNKNILTYDRANSELNNEQLNCLDEDAQKNLLIGTNADEVLRFSPQKGIINSYHLGQGDVECLFFDKITQQIFIENGSLQVFDPKESMPKYHISTSAEIGTPKDMASFKKDFLVVATGGGANIVSKDGKSSVLPHSLYHKNFVVDRLDRLWLRKVRSRTVSVDETNDRIWVGYADGLYYYENGKEYELKTPQNEAIIAIDLVFDATGTLWIGTTQQGIFEIKNLEIIRHLNTAKGLISNFCRVLRLDKGKLWIGTEKGIQVWNFPTNTFYIINKESGLASNEIKDLRLQDSLVWVASAKGLTVFNKNYVPQKAPSPLIHLTNLEINEQKQKLKESYTLSYSQNNLKIDFVGINFKSAGKFWYQYRLKGLSDEWIKIKSSTNFVRFMALPAGTYTFEVKAINADGVESKQTARIFFEIAYPLWQQWWFILLIILLGIALISGIFMIRIRAIHRRNKLKNELIHANLKALKTQMNPHFIFNNLSSIQDFIVQEKNEEAEYYLTSSARLTRQILEASRQDYISLAEELEILKTYLSLEQDFSEHRFEYTFNIDENIDIEAFKIPPLFVQPFIENAIKHGLKNKKVKGQIEVSFSLANKLVLIEVVDNGIGRKKAESKKSLLQASRHTAEKHRSLATQITNERIELLQGSISKSVRLEIEDILDENKEVAGTKVKLFLPYKTP